MIFALVARDLRSRYVGTLGGILWTVAHPVAVIAVFYFVFTIGFKSHGPDGAPFLLWFMCGIVPWFFFNETLSAASDSVTRHTHFIKKIVFPSEVLPVVSILVGLVPHTVFLFIVAGLLAWFEVPFVVGRLLVLYFFFCSCVLVLGLGWLLSAIQVFYRDISHGLSIILNLWFWATPIVWPPENVPEAYRELLYYNPIYYIVDGYRGLLVFHTLAWPNLLQTIYFWGMTGVTLLVGAYVFSQLKPEFPDVI